MIDYSDLALEKDDSELEFMDFICKYDNELFDDDFEITSEFAQIMRGVVLRMFEHNNGEYRKDIARLYSNIIRARYKPCDIIDYVGIIQAIGEALSNINDINDYPQLRNLDDYCNEAFNNLKNDPIDGRYIRNNNLTIDDFSFKQIIKDLEEMDKKIHSKYYMKNNHSIFNYTADIDIGMIDRFYYEPENMDHFKDDNFHDIDILMIFYGDNIRNNNLDSETIRQIRRVLQEIYLSCRRSYKSDIGMIYTYMIDLKYYTYKISDLYTIFREPDYYVMSLTRDTDFTYYLNYWIQEFDDGEEIFKEEYEYKTLGREKFQGEMPEEFRLQNLIHPRYILEKFKEHDVKHMYTQIINKELEKVNRKWGI